jgi:hypothetical protein
MALFSPRTGGVQQSAQVCTEGKRNPAQGGFGFDEQRGFSFPDAHRQYRFYNAQPDATHFAVSLSFIKDETW